MIYLVSLYYPPENNPASNRFSTFAQALIDEYGVDGVQVVTGRPNFPDGVLPPEFRWKPYQKRTGGLGETVHHLYEVPTSFEGKFRKTLNFFSFAVSLGFFLLFRRFRKDDLIYITSGPVFPVYAVWAVRLLKRNMRYAMDVRDIWPEALTAMGMVNEKGPVYRCLLWLTHQAYQKAVFLSGNSDGIVDHLREAAPQVPVHTLYNPVDFDLFQPVVEDERIAFRRERPELFGPPGSTAVLFYGAHALYNDLMLVMRAARTALSQRDDLVFIFIGRGDEKTEMEGFVAEHGLASRVHFLPYMPRQEIVRFVQASDVGLASVKNHPHLRYMLPTKIPEFLACDCPLLVLVHEPLASTLRDMDCGVVISPGDEAALAEAFVDAKPRPTQSDLRGKARDRFGRAAIAGKLMDVLSALPPKA